MCINIRINISRYALVMASTLIRYCNTVLLAWAVMALATNPVWHAAGHFFSDRHDETVEHVSDHHWTEQDICPFCDAVSQYTETAKTEAPGRQRFLLGQLDRLEPYFTHRRFPLHARLRAPPRVA